MSRNSVREIPFNYTSADDRQIVRHLFGEDVWQMLDRLRFQRRTGRSARLLLRIFGDVFMLQRNPYVVQELADSPAKRRHFFRDIAGDLEIIEHTADGNPDVLTIIARTRQVVNSLASELSGLEQKRDRIRRELGAVVGPENVFFDPFTLICHATDATDWRLHLPAAVVYPAEELQAARLLTAIQGIGLYAIPRGAGTGMTGGSVPVHSDCVIINTEKLNRIEGMETRDFAMPDGSVQQADVLRVQAGVITESAMTYASERGRVFAVDPTSSWACTIGGNIAENAGGKTAVLWGTAIDNLLSFQIAMPGNRCCTVRRIDHPLRKIYPEDAACFEVLDESGRRIQTIELKGTEIRKKGLGKDITNKALKGLPGVQKEGTDGVITSAEFILHKAYPQKMTFCLEFFGKDMEEASRVICRLSEVFVNRGEEALMALEHFDEEYVRAIGYKVKAPKRERPKAVLLIDMVAHAPEHLARGRKTLEALLEPYPNTFVFTAADRAEAARYWQDRKKMGAIAARTNAFKLNEDIVLPLDRLADFAAYADDLNTEEDRCNQKEVLWQIGAYLDNAQPREDPQWLAEKLPRARQLLMAAIDPISLAGKESLRAEEHLQAALNDLLKLFRGYDRVSGEIRKIYDDIRGRLIVIATHMHAGDGNVHVNIPVFSNNRDMMAQAAETADAVMAMAVELGGAVSGEHGIGFTKFRHLAPERVAELAAYRKAVDPDGLMNPGKLSDPLAPDAVFTPSHELLGVEARILSHCRLEDLAGKISKCMRCGRCKPVCSMLYPAKNLFAHPRNKNLAVRALIEAILYNAQRFQSTRFDSLKHLEDIADHCTICHKCMEPCPVDIDTGEVSVLEREILKSFNAKHTPLPTRLSLAYLQSRSELFNSAFRKTVLCWGSAFQRAGTRAAAMLPGKALVGSSKLLGMLRSPISPPSAQTLRHILPECRPNQAAVISPPDTVRRTVFYFPGCGSERLYSDISKAAVYILLKTGTRVVLPPPYICCGFPPRVNAAVDAYDQQILRNAIIFNQIHEMCGYMEFAACVVSCGTCRETLEKMRVDDQFGVLEDVSRFALENGLAVNPGGSRLYHAPCHDSLKNAGAKLLETFGGYQATLVPHCCSESGTLALSRPDISEAMRARKKDALCKAMDPSEGRSILLTNCPSCLQGLGRNAKLNVQPRHLTVELALNCGGEKWESELRRMLSKTEIIVF